MSTQHIIEVLGSILFFFNYTYLCGIAFTYLLFNLKIIHIYKKDKNTYSVEGGKIIRLANVTDTRNIDQLYRFQNILASMNVYEALKQAGIKEGDVVKIGHIQFDYYD